MAHRTTVAPINNREDATGMIAMFFTLWHHFFFLGGKSKNASCCTCIQVPGLVGESLMRFNFEVVSQCGHKWS